jgi:cell division protease FtsH
MKDKNTLWYYLFALLAILSIQSIFFTTTPNVEEISYKSFLDQLNEKKISKVVIMPDRIVGEYADAESPAKAQAAQEKPRDSWQMPWNRTAAEQKRKFVVKRLPGVDDEQLLPMLRDAGVDYSGNIDDNFLRNFFLNWILPFGILFLIWGYIFRKMNAGSSVLSIGKNKAKIYAEDPKNQVTFKDVAGVDEAVEEVKELVEFLKNPKKYTQLGGKLPKGVLLVGPPGTGKTLLAKAVAGEAKVPFFSMSGSDFVEMFVGVGASRVRDLFQQAKEKAPCIIFIDEIDAIGKSRSRNSIMGGGYDERENTLNQLLVEMDGFDPGAGVIIIGATNRPDVLDPALLRPGRFDRQVLVDKPDLNGRIAIFKVHTKSLKLGSDVDLKRLASQTPGFAGAEIANVCNEAALLAVRKNKKTVDMQDFEEAIERIIAGLEKKNKLINEHERKIVAYHESGHAIVGYFTPGADSVQKVSIVPRGFGALGYTLQMPLEDRYLMTRSELLGKIKGLLGGRAAEEIVFGEISTGASNDLERVSQIARNMVVVYGMSEKLPNLSLVQDSGPNFLGQGANLNRRSEEIERIIDQEVLSIIQTCYEETKALLMEKRELLDKMSEALLEKEVLNYHEIRELLGETTHHDATETAQ